MAVSAPLITRQRTIAAKTETTTGTAIALAAGDAAINAYDPQFTHDIEFVERPAQGTATNLKGQTGARGGGLTFWSELMGDGSGNELALLTSLLPAVGLTETSGNVFTPVSGSSSAPTLTMGLFTDGDLQQIAGATGNLELTFEYGKPVKMNWDFKGVTQADTAVPLISPTYPTTNPMMFAGATLTVGAYTPKVSSMTINLGNEVVLREDATNAAGYLSAVIVNRNVTVTMDPESDAIGTKSWQADLLAETEAALNLVVSSSTDQCTIAIPKLQVTKVTPGDRNGIYIRQIEAQANHNGSDDDEMTMTFAAAP